MTDRPQRALAARSDAGAFEAIIRTAVVLALCHGRAAAQSDPDEPYGKIVKEIRLPELEWTKPHVILRELVSKVGEVYTPEDAALDLERLRAGGPVRVPDAVSRSPHADFNDAL